MTHKHVWRAVLPQGCQVPAQPHCRTSAVEMCELGTALQGLCAIQFKGDGFNYKWHNLKRFCSSEKLLKILAGKLNKWSFIASLHLCMAAGCLTRTSAVRLIYYTPLHFTFFQFFLMSSRFVALSQHFFHIPCVLTCTNSMSHNKIANPSIPAAVVNKLVTLPLLNYVKSL